MSTENRKKQKFGYITLLESNKGGAGFFANYFFVLSSIMTSHRINLKPYVNLNNSAFVENYNPYTDSLPKNAENTWNWWFDQELPSEEDNLISVGASSFSQSEKFWKRNDIPYARSIADKYIHIKQHILKQIDVYYNEQLKNHIVLGVMARGCEMNRVHPEYGNQTIETWINSTKNILAKHSEIDLIFLVTEDSNYIITYLNEFPNAVYLKKVFRRTTETLDYINKFILWPCIANSRENHCRLLGEECLIQALLLSKCDYLLGKQCGTLSGAIFYANENLKDVFYV